MASVHLYTAALQPATRYVVDIGNDEPNLMTLRLNARHLIRCSRCERLRWASRCVVQVYYDAHVFSCADRARCTKLKREPRRSARRGRQP